MAEEFDRKAVVGILNRILEAELSGVVRYTHYSFMVYGYSRIPIVSWLREQAAESLGHAHRAGETITHLGEHPSLSIGRLLETHKHDVGDILREALDNEKQGLALYEHLLKLVQGRSVFLEEYARELVAAEESHLGEVDKMLRRPGDIASTSNS
jgi:bacterioferritin